MNESTLVLLIQVLIKYGPDVALAIANLFKTGTTIDQAIAALEAAKTKTAQDYLDAAKEVEAAKAAVAAVVPANPA